MGHTPLQRFWYYIHLLEWKDRVFEILAPHGVTDFKNLPIEKAEEVADAMRLEWSQRSKKPRGAVIYYLCSMPKRSYTINGKPDYEKIDAWVMSKFDGKALNQLPLPELVKAVTMAKEWYRKEIK